MANFSTIVKMQLKEKINISSLKNKKQTLFKVVFGVLRFIIVVAIAYLLFYVSNLLNLFSIINHIPLSVIAVIFAIMYVLNFISSVITLTKSLYEASDNQLLITLPVNANVVFVSKLVVHLVHEINKTFSFIAPVLFAYGIVSGLPIVFYVWMPLMLCLLAVFTVLLSGLVSIPWVMIMKFLNRFKILKWVIAIGLISCLIYFAFYLIRLIPTNINIISSWREISIALREFLSWFTKNFSLIYIFVVFLCGYYENFHVQFFTSYSYIVPLVLLASIVVLILLNMLLSRPMYLKAISSNFEFNKKSIKQKKNVELNSDISSAFYETKKIVRNADVLLNCALTIIVAPIVMFALNKIYGAIDTRLFGDYLTIAFNILIILLFTLSTNISVASIFSRDGNSFYINKTTPKRPQHILFSRLLFNMFISLIVLGGCCAVFFHFASIKIPDKVLIFLSLYCVNLIHLFWSAEMDFLNLQTHAFGLEGKATKNPNEMKSTILSFGISLIVFGIVAFFLINDSKNFFIKLFFLSAAVLILRVVLFSYKAKILFREK